MDYFLQVFGEITVGKAAVVIGAVIFLAICYKKVEGYFSEKAIREQEKDKEIKECLEQIKMYPKWRQQSIDIQNKFAADINELKAVQKKNIQRMEEIESANRKRERNKLRDRLLQSYRYFTSREKNPLLAWSQMEAEAFWKIFKDYEELDGNGYVHSDVQPAMNSLEIIQMHETERISELMHSRK